MSDRIAAAELQVLPYSLESITAFELIQEVNEHVSLRVGGLVSDEAMDRYVEQAEAGETIQVVVKDGEQAKTLFHGMLTSISVQYVQGVRRLMIEAGSSTLWMDMVKQTRSFQDEQRTYLQLFKQLLGSYSPASLRDEASTGKETGGLLMQYQETDWCFMKRLASHFQAPLIPGSAREGIQLYVGLPEGGEPLELQEHNYEVHNQVQEYQRKVGSGVELMGAQGSLAYHVTSPKWMELGRRVMFQGKMLHVARVNSQLEQGVLIHSYELRAREGLKVPREYNTALTGVSLFGRILAVAKDKVQVRLHDDESRNEGGRARWFPYSTVYSSPDGTGWYCMPEVGDEVRLYFPDRDEQHAFAASSVDTASSNSQKRSDPEIKSISTKYGKQIVFKPGAVEIVGGGGLLLRLTDDGGIELNSDKKISLMAQEDIEIVGGAKIVLQGESGIELTQAGASLKIEDEVTLRGGRVNME